MKTVMSFFRFVFSLFLANFLLWIAFLFAYGYWPEGWLAKLFGYEIITWKSGQNFLFIRDILVSSFAISLILRLVDWLYVGNSLGSWLLYADPRQLQRDPEKSPFSFYHYENLIAAIAMIAAGAVFFILTFSVKRDLFDGDWRGLAAWVSFGSIFYSIIMFFFIRYLENRQEVVLPPLERPVPIGGSVLLGLLFLPMSLSSILYLYEAFLDHNFSELMIGWRDKSEHRFCITFSLPYFAWPVVWMLFFRVRRLLHRNSKITISDSA